MEKVSLGELTTAETPRDAVHVAIASLRVAESGGLEPGQRVKLSDDRREIVKATGAYALGVVDPFLRSAVPYGAYCYVLLRPNTVTSLRHEWCHPAFPEQ